jgi:predicted transcriptional regulator of viral defense system
VARSSTLHRLGRIAEEQWGLVTRRQAERVADVAPATFARLASGSGSILERVAHGVYHLTGAPLPDHLDLRAAWLQLAPETPAWERRPHQGVVSHRSAAALYGFGHLPADRHDFTLPRRRQSRRPDVRLRRRDLKEREWTDLRGLPVTRPPRTASDLLSDREDPGAVAHLVADAIRSGYDSPGTFVDALAPHAARFGLRQGDGFALFRWLLDLVGDPETSRWLDEARAQVNRKRAEQASPDEAAQ